MKRFVLLCVALACVLSAVPSFARDKLAVYWSFTEKHMQYPRVKKALEAFENKHNVDVVFLKKSAFSTDELHEAYLRLFSAKSETPDVIQIDFIRIPEFASLNHLVDLTPYFPPSERAKFFKNTVDESTWEGRVWAAPYFVTFGSILYRKDLMDVPPRTWEELIEIAGRLKNEKKIYGYVGQMAEYEGLTCNALEFLWAAGGSPDFSGKGKMFSAKDVAGLQLMVDLVSKYKITPPDQLKYKEYEGLQLMSEEKAVFIRHWPEALFQLEERGIRVGDKYNFVRMPGMKGNKNTHAMLGGWALGVNRHSKNTKVAVELVKLLTSEEMQKHLIMILGRLPARKSIYKDKEVIARYPWVKKAYPLVTATRARPRSPYYPEISKIMQKEFHLALEGKITPQQAVDRAERKIKAFYKSIGKQGGQR